MKSLRDAIRKIINNSESKSLHRFTVSGLFKRLYVSVINSVKDPVETPVLESIADSVCDSFWNHIYTKKQKKLLLKELIK